jgi:hypothetical protein
MPGRDINDDTFFSTGGYFLKQTRQFTVVRADFIPRIHMFGKGKKGSSACSL